MRASRLLSTLILLQLRGHLTADELAAEFEVSVRTIYRDMDHLSAAGIPLYADRGPGGGFRLLDGYKTRLTGLTAKEAEAVLLAGLPDAAADLGLGEALAAARLKLLAAMPPGIGEGARRIGERFHLDPADWYSRAVAPPHLAGIAEAVWRERRLRLRYESWSRTAHRTVDPLGLVMKAGVWYLVARASGGIRTYKIAKVLELEVLEEGFERPSGFDLAAQWRKDLRRFEASLRRSEAVLRVSAAALPGLSRLGADVAEAILAATPDAKSWRQATVPIESAEHAAGLLLGFGGEVEVVRPKELRECLADRARQVLALYGGRPTSSGAVMAAKRKRGPGGPRSSVA